MFLHPFLAILGIGAVSVPIIIHLLNRRRFQVVRWGAMSFLLNAYKKTRRRLEMENLLLLILRALAVLLIGLGIARPRLSDDLPLIQIGDSRRDVIIAIDSSWSMSHREGATRAWERALAEARRIIDALKPERQDRATVILAKQKPIRLSASSIQNAREALSRATDPSFESMDLAATLALAASEADEFAPEGPGGLRDAAKNGSGATLFLITDLQRSNFFPRVEKPGDAAANINNNAGGPGAATQPVNNNNSNNTNNPKEPVATVSTTPLQAAAQALATKKVNMRVVDVGSGDAVPDNVGISRVYCSEDFPATGVPLELRAAIRNFGSSPRANIVINATVDGNRESPQTIASLAAGAEREVLFNLTFREPGDHTVEISTEEDRLAPDDRRSFVLAVRPPMKVLLVDGAPTGELETSGAGMLALALAPPAEPVAASPFQIVGDAPVDRARFSTQQELLDQADVVIFANVEGLTDEQARRVREYAEGGGSVLFVLGNNVDPNSYSLRFHAGENPAEWIFPGVLTGVREIPSREHPPFRVSNITEPFPRHLAFFEPAERRVFLTEIPVYKFYGVDVTPEDERGGARVLARYNDPDLNPFFIVKDIGRGHIGVITTALDLSPDQRWSRIADQPRTFLPLLFDGLHALTSGTRDDRNVNVGRPIRAEVRGFPRNITVLDPASRNEKVTVDEKKKFAGDRYPIEYIKTDRPGIYQMEVEIAGGVGSVNTTNFRFAAALDPAEGDLTRAAADTIGSQLTGLDVRVGGSVDPEKPTTPQNKQNNEIWPFLLGGALAILIMESLLALWFGRRRS